jgi:hypothetical protein
LLPSEHYERLHVEEADHISLSLIAILVRWTASLQDFPTLAVYDWEAIDFATKAHDSVSVRPAFSVRPLRYSLLPHGFRHSVLGFRYSLTLWEANADRRRVMIPTSMIPARPYRLAQAVWAYSFELHFDSKLLAGLFHQENLIPTLYRLMAHECVSLQA